MNIKSPSVLYCAAICNMYKMCSYYSYNDDDKLCLIHSNLEEDTIQYGLQWRIYEPVITDCPVHWDLFEDNCYFFSPHERSWHDSKVYCVEQQSMLVEVKSSTQKNFLKGKAIEHLSSYWIGATDLETEGVWKWNTSQTGLTVTDWSPNQPDNYLGNQDCVQIMKSEGYTWDDNLCEALRAFICEKPIFS
ncbi:unnamed protein product [Mytilus coruscus]|uniref:C-type lectin domain-containing protein n=1 Tax=Mytilus coruscus TaxID=42192 RepID=A0A6J8ER91_MYTCO|nr:unnamed protein product [Mytilus coruscus]